MSSARTVTELPHAVRVEENVWIPMSDGCRLAARLWLPEDAGRRPVPAVLEYIPYVKRYGTRVRDDIRCTYVAGHGYACVRVDMRGSGDSDGVLADEYLPQEQQDGLEVLRWIADQPWCDGAVGMIGISWGGFNGLQIAALNPPELRAVVSVCSTDDRYADDVHYMGGCQLGDNLSWASVMFGYNSRPPDPEIVGPRWRELWLQRLEGSGLWLEKWLRHQRRDAYWRHGSVCEDFTAIRCPVLAVSGWADGYSNAVFRLVQQLGSPSKGLVGPWSHRYPDMGEPGPAIGFLQETLRWWDQWLKGEETGVADEPALRVYMQDSAPPSTRHETRAGRWVAEASWPSPRIQTRTYTLTPARLEPAGHAPVPEARAGIRSPLSLGLFAGKWCSYGGAPDLPGDQRQEDGGALVFDTEPLAGPLEILGAAEVELELEVDRPVAQVAARLSDVAPGGDAARVTYGLINLTHRESHEDPTPLEPGRRYRVLLRMNDIAQVFPAGHRIRLALSTSYWPLAWPAPEPTHLVIHCGVSRLHLPVRPPDPADAELRPFAGPEGCPVPATTELEPPRHAWRVLRDLGSDVSTLEVEKSLGRLRLESIDLERSARTTERYTVRGDDLDSLRGEVRSEHGLRRGDWRVRTVTRTVLTSTATHFHVVADLDAYEGERRVYCRSWERWIERDLL